MRPNPGVLLLAVLVIAGCRNGAGPASTLTEDPKEPDSAVARETLARSEPVILAAGESVSLIPPTGMVLVPAGPFFRGCSDGFGDVKDDRCAPSEFPASIVTIDAFFIDVNEVTVGRYTACVDAGGCQAPYDGGECNYGEKGRLDYPINCVTWDDARRFCAWEGRRLPTEAEWEKAARGTDGRRYPWGNDEPDAGGVWRANLGEGLTKLLWMRDQWEYDGPVGFFSAWASPHGCNDMAGNVAEWVADWWADSYAGAASVNPRGPSSGSQHVVRGGSFREYRQRIRTGARGYHYTDFMDSNVGFRCAADTVKR